MHPQELAKVKYTNKKCPFFGKKRTPETKFIYQTHVFWTLLTAWDTWGLFTTIGPELSAYLLPQQVKICLGIDFSTGILSKFLTTRTKINHNSKTC